VAAILEELGIRYVIGGSVASSLMGEPRSTLDLDVMIVCDADSVRNLVGRLQEAFYVDESDALRAVADQSAFNAIHLPSSLKVDFFLAERAPFAAHQIERRRAIDVGGVRLYFYAPEDLIVRKLMWFRLGAETSERQWRDVLGISRPTRTSMPSCCGRRLAKPGRVICSIARYKPCGEVWTPTRTRLCNTRPSRQSPASAPSQRADLVETARVSDHRCVCRDVRLHPRLLLVTPEAVIGLQVRLFLAGDKIHAHTEP